jgi:neurotransmitter:Na+ symporter, NSS family
MSDRHAVRPTFTSGVAAILAMVGVAIGLGNFWRFPYLVGRHGGAAFVLIYLVCLLLVGIPALVAEWSLGRHTRRGTVGAFQRAGFPLGRFLGWFFFAIVLAATAYYSAAVGWVLGHAVAAALRILGLHVDPGRILPPAIGFDRDSFLLQVTLTSSVIACAGFVIARGLRRGVESVSRLLVPLLFVVLLALIARGLTLPGAGAGVHWYLLKASWSDVSPAVVLAALGQVVFSLALGGTFMVVYGSYLDDRHDLRRAALATAAADTTAGLLAGLAIFPAVFALGLEPASGPTLIFETLPRVFETIRGGPFFALLFFGGLSAVALLSVIAALEVVVAGLVDNTRFERTGATLLICCIVLALSLPPSINLRVFVPWDLTFGSGMQTLGALLAVLAFAWSLDRGSALAQLSRHGRVDGWAVALHAWIRWFVPGAILLVGVWWLVLEVFGVVAG